MDKLDQFIVEMFDYYSKDVRSGAAKVYRRALKSIEIDQLYKMFDLHITDPDSGQFMPKVADFVKVNAGTKKGNAVAAWNKVYTAISIVGPYKNFTIDDPWAMKCIDEIGGFQRLCELTDRELDFKRNEFEKLYESYRSQGVPDQFPAKIKGLIDKENGTDTEPFLIGDKDRANRVLIQGANKIAHQITAPKNISNILRLKNNSAIDKSCLTVRHD